jgi:hypothetical protein
MREIAHKDKKRRFALPTPQTLGAHEGWLFSGKTNDLRRFIVTWLIERLLKKPPAAIEMRVWQDTELNKIFILDSELKAANAHVATDVFDSVESH